MLSESLKRPFPGRRVSIMSRQVDRVAELVSGINVPRATLQAYVKHNVVPPASDSTAVGYARVSTADQSLDAQRDALSRAGCGRVFTDHASGKLAKRPGLSEALDYLRAGDTLVITKLDRLGRSIRNLIELVAQLNERGVALRVLDQGIDTSTPGGKMFFHVVAAIGEFEADMISERTNDGLAAARARGRVGGRRPKLTGAKLDTARRLVAEKELTMTEVANILGCSRATLYRALDTKLARAAP